MGSLLGVKEYNITNQVAAIGGVVVQSVNWDKFVEGLEEGSLIIEIRDSKGPTAKCFEKQERRLRAVDSYIHKSRDKMKVDIEELQPRIFEDILAKLLNLFKIAMEKVEAARDGSGVQPMWVAKDLLKEIAILYKLQDHEIKITLVETREELEEAVVHLIRDTETEHLFDKVVVNTIRADINFPRKLACA